MSYDFPTKTMSYNCPTKAEHSAAHLSLILDQLHDGTTPSTTPTSRQTIPVPTRDVTVPTLATSANTCVTGAVVGLQQLNDPKGSFLSKLSSPANIFNAAASNNTTPATTPTAAAAAKRAAAASSTTLASFAAGVTTVTTVTTAKKEMKCIPLKPPIPQCFQGDMKNDIEVCCSKTAGGESIPNFSCIINFPEYNIPPSEYRKLLRHLQLQQKQQENVNGEDKSEIDCSLDGLTKDKHGNNLRHCVMCGQKRPIKASSSGRGSNKKKQAEMAMSPTNGTSTNADGLALTKDGVVVSIPNQNRGLCTLCDVTVWVYTRTNLQVKWCKGCKNFRTWASFGEKGHAAKCLRCRDQQRRSYAHKESSNAQVRTSDLMLAVAGGTSPKHVSSPSPRKHKSPFSFERQNSYSSAQALSPKRSRLEDLATTAVSKKQCTRLEDLATTSTTFTEKTPLIHLGNTPPTGNNTGPYSDIVHDFKRFPDHPSIVTTTRSSAGAHSGPYSKLIHSTSTGSCSSTEQQQPNGYQRRPSGQQTTCPGGRAAVVASSSADNSSITTRASTGIPPTVVGGDFDDDELNSSDDHYLWMGIYYRLCEYKAKFGNCLVPYHYEPDEELGKWVHSQRVVKEAFQQQHVGIAPSSPSNGGNGGDNQNSGKISPLTIEQVNKLNGIGFVWKIKNNDLWDDMFEQLLTYHRKYGSTNPSTMHNDEKSGENYDNLCKWVNRQRALYKCHTLPTERIHKLTSIGFKFRNEGDSNINEIKHMNSANSDGGIVSEESSTAETL